MENSALDVGAIGVASLTGIGTEVGASIGYFVATTIVRTVLTVVFFWVGLAVLATTPLTIGLYYAIWDHKKIKIEMVKKLKDKMIKDR